MKLDELQITSQDIYKQKYSKKDINGKPTEDIHQTFSRVAKALASIEKSRDRSKWQQEFLNIMEKGAIPGGRIIANAGNSFLSTSTINCVVSDEIEDSLESIYQQVSNGAKILQRGCGIGLPFGNLRPKGEYVKGINSGASGVLSFMNVFNESCKTVQSSGDRRGAQMGTLEISHPEIIDFVTAKRQKGVLDFFNISVLVSDKFMYAVKNDLLWELTFGGNGKIYQTIRARELWELILRSNYEYGGEPGVLFIDRINKYNNLWFCEKIRACNPCGEQPLPANGACLLGSIDLTKYVVNPFQENAYFNIEEFSRTVHVFTRMLDNVVAINNLPLEKQRQSIEYTRRHGMGLLGLGSAMALLGIRYGSKESLDFTEKCYKTLAYSSYLASAQLSKDKGEAPVLKTKFNKKDILNTHLNTNFANNKDSYTGRELFLLSHSFDVYQNDSEGLNVLAELMKYGSRSSHCTTQAPTGTTSLSICNNASSGIEPTFEHEYLRNIIIPERNTKLLCEVFSKEALMWKKINGDNEYPDYFVTAKDLTPEQHIAIQAKAQEFIDTSVSKTINVPYDTEYHVFDGLYSKAYESGLKGCTTFRPDSNRMGVLLTKEILDSRTYELTINGKKQALKGSQKIIFNGEETVVANLAEAINSGRYGKY